MFSTQLLTLNYLLYSPTNAAPEFLQKFTPIYNWLRGWPEFSGPITARGNAEPMQSLITFWASIKGALSGRFPTYCDSRSATFQIHTADQLPTILFTEVFLGSVQKPFSSITSDYIKVPVQNSLTKCTSPMYQRRNSYPRVRSWAITFSLLNCVPPSYPPMLTTTFRLLHC